MSAIDVASPLRRAAERRAATQPYPRRRPRRSQRLGNPNDGDVNENEHDDEEHDGDALLDEAREETAAAARGGLFSRLFSFFPLGGSKKPVEPTKQVDALDASMASTSDHDDEKAELETSQESLEMVVEVAVKSPVKSPLAETAVSNGRTKPSRSPPSKRSSPARVRAAEKKLMSPLPVSSVFGHSSDKTKTLQIGSTYVEKEPFAFQRVTGRRRSKPSSPRVTESPLAVIKKKKPISFEEYERLSTQLRNLVEATPENALALTRSTLSNALEPRGSGDAPASEVAGRDRRELSVAALPSVKRARPSEDLPITLPREDRLTRKPKPSRLLTGTKRDVASRSAYSAAVAEKILSTLNKIQTPLDKESQKPTPSTSLSWAKYQLALTKQESSTHGEDESMDADDQVAPPTVSVPKVAWKPAVVEVPPKTASVVAKTPTFSFPKPAANVEEPPAADVSASATSSSTSKASSVATAQTTIKSQYGSVSATGPTPQRQMGQFAFTLPQPASPSSKTTIDESVQYVFTPPPALREPPKRSPGQKALTAKSASTTTPFSFMPSSPRVRPESLTKSVPRKEKSPEKVAAPVSSASAAAPSSATNPLARFMQVDAGSWRCSTCAVMNAANLSKCPCCETAKPLSESSSAGSAISVAPASVSSTPAGANPLARFMQMEPGSWKCPSCAVTNGAKYVKCPCCDTNKPGSAPTGNVKPSEPSSSAPVSTASSGFTFGVSTVEPKKTEVVAPATSGFKFGVESPKNASTSLSGFSFGVSAQSSSAPVSSSAPAPVSSGFTFGVAAPPKTASDSLKPTGGFTFGATSTSASANSKSISTKRKSSDEQVREGSGKKPAMPSSTVSPTQKTAEGFTFNVAASSSFGASASGFGTGDADKSKPTGGFTFGSTTTASGSVSKTPFTFGSSDGASATKVPEPSFVSSDQKTHVTPFKFGASDEKTATPLFTFGSSSAKPTEEKPADPKPSFTFGATSAPSTETKPTDSKPSFTFGTPAVSEPKPASSSPPKVPFGFPPAEAAGSTEKNAPFTFGAAATPANSQSASAVVTKPAFEFGSSTPSVSFGASASTISSSAATTASPAFAFGAASSDNIAKKVEAPAFTFGGSSTSGGAASAFSGDKPPTSAFGQAPAFGSTAPSSSGFGASSRSFSPIPSTTGFGAMTSTGFGSTTTPAVSSGFGSAVSSGFGSSTSSGFGTTSGTFGSTSASTSFGSTPTTTPSFSTTPSSTPGAPAFAFGASTPATSQSGFGFGAPTTSSAFTTPTSSAFGASSQTSGFGSAPAGGAFGSTTSASGFGMNSSQPFGSTPTPSPAFGAAGNGSGFGGNAFGASAPVSGAFGVPTPTPLPAFGGSSSTFGAPSASFGAPGNAFGATPSPAAAAFRSSTPSPVFGAPATPSFGAPPTPSFGAPSAGFGSAPAFGGQQQPPTDGFNMGSAPPKRRILKAKSRPKRA